MEPKEAHEILSAITHNNPKVNEALHYGAASIDRWEYLKTTIDSWKAPDPNISEDYRFALEQIRDVMREIEGTYK